MIWLCMIQDLRGPFVFKCKLSSNIVIFVLRFCDNILCCQGKEGKCQKPQMGL